MKVKLTLGDYSADSHGRVVEILLDVNKSLEEIRQAYKDSCLNVGVQFGSGYNKEYRHVSNADWHLHGDKLVIDDDIRVEAIQRLAAHGIDLMDYSSDDQDIEIEDEDYAILVMDFIKLSLPDLEYEPIFTDIPSINEKHFKLGYKRTSPW
jgi:hypothetical protein